MRQAWNVTSVTCSMCDLSGSTSAPSFCHQRLSGAKVGSGCRPPNLWAANPMICTKQPTNLPCSWWKGLKVMTKWVGAIWVLRSQAVSFDISQLFITPWGSSSSLRLLLMWAQNLMFLRLLSHDAGWLGKVEINGRRVNPLSLAFESFDFLQLDSTPLLLV